MISKFRKWASSLAIATIFALTLAPLIPPVHAQSSVNILGLDRLLKSVPVNVANTTEDADVAIQIRYIGSLSGTVQISSGDVLLKVGASGSEVADTTITGCGGTAGTLDVDNAACDTIVETVNRINASANWRAVWIDAIGTDNDAGAKFLTLAATAANRPDGLSINWDTSVAFHTTRALVPYGLPVVPVTGVYFSYRTIAPYLNGVGNSAMVERPFNDVRTFLTYGNFTTTYGSGTSTIQFLDCDTHFRATATFAAGSSESCSVVFSVAGGATTVNKVIADFEFNPFVFTPGNRALVRVSNSAAASVPTVVASGYMVPAR